MHDEASCDSDALRWHDRLPSSLMADSVMPGQQNPVPAVEPRTPN